ncbi:MAG TPA: ATP-dependent DNA helicase RecG [Streptosporangiaceae bacterium]|nr:ATP-dependent DNA helicase RecG [Streptosporangiaceae bacterium]
MAVAADPLRLVVGDKAAKRLASVLDLRTVGDLLGYYPRRYDKRGELTDLAGLREGEYVTVQAEVASSSVRKMNNRPGTIFEAVVTDGHGKLTLTFFGHGRQDYRERQLSPGVRGLFSGQVSSFRGKRQLTHPEYELLGEGSSGARAEEYANELIPVYRASAQLQSWRIADSIRVVLDVLDVPGDPLPADLRARHGLCGYADALRGIHRPVDEADVARARLRLKWDEAFTLQVLLAQRRLAATSYSAIQRPAVAGGLLTEFDAMIPFELTAGQRQTGRVIAADLERDHPMHRLLQGEVGSGKTIIALRAMLQVADAAGQAALLAPTEVLAQQHFRSISSLLGPLGMAGQLGGAEHATRLTLITGSLGAAARRKALLEAASGEAGIIIGTHALLEDRVQFADLGLVVIDEQHRFGVEQRDALRDKAGDGRPHMLVMTATPIPRTVAMTVFGDLDVSTLTELPAGRSPISTHVVPVAERPHYLARTWERIREEVGHGRQAYVVCPRIGGDEAGLAGDEVAGPGSAGSGSAGSASAGSGSAGSGSAGFAQAGSGPTAGRQTRASQDELFEEPEPGPSRPPIAVLDLAAELAAGPLAGLRLAILHGRLPPDEKDKVMLAFADGLVDVLITTTVIEVGVDVPNAVVMVIMDADRFGVSQLHQLRGRVGRGANPGLCLLVTEAPEAAPARERLDAVAETADGFALSRIDLEQRREGDVLGTAQAGRRSSLKLLQLLRDEDLIGQAREEAIKVVDADPALADQPALAEAVRSLVDAEQTTFLEKA